MNNKTGAAIAAIASSVNWERSGLDLQSIIEAANQGKLGKPLTDWFVNQGWNSEAETTKPANLKPLVSLFEYVSTVKIAATTIPFIAKDRFVENTSDDAPVKIWNIWDGFKTRFLQDDGKVEQPIGDTELRYARLKKRSVDTPILEELGGGKKPRTTLIEVYALMTKQPKGEKGTLLVNGYTNIFYVETEVILPEERYLAYTNEEGKEVVLCAVSVRWDDGCGWFVSGPLRSLRRSVA